MRVWAVLTATCALTVFPVKVRAARGVASHSETQAAPAGTASALENRLPLSAGGHLYVGGGGGGSGVKGPVFGADAFFRYRLVEAGALCEFLAPGLDGASVAGCGGMLGPSFRWGWFALDVAAVVGRRNWAAVGGGPAFSENPGGAATLWFAGLRVGASAHLEWFVAGLWAGLDDDLGRKHVTYSYVPPIFGPAPNPEPTGEADIGAATFFVSARFGVDFDW